MRGGPVSHALYRLEAPLIEIWENNIHTLLLSRFLYVLGAIVFSPYQSTMLTNYFGELHAGHPIQCVGLPPGEEPPLACKNAHDDVIAWNAGKSFICNLILCAVLTPLFSRWSDFYGRKPFLIFGMVLYFPKMLVILSYLSFGFPLWWYYPASCISSMFTEGVLTYSYISDVVSPEHRTFIFGLSGTPFALAAMLGPLPTVLGWLKSPAAAAWIYFSLVTAALLIIICFVRESLSKEDKQKAQANRKSMGPNLSKWNPAVAARDFWSSFRILFRTDYFLKLTVVVVILYMLFEEVMEIEMQYFQEVAGFGTQDQAMLMTMQGVLSLLIQSVGLWFLTSALNLSNKHILVLGLTMYAAKMLILTFCNSKAMAMIAVAVGSFVFVIFPAIASIKSAYVSREEQGAVQGALGGAQALAQGIGPILFFSIFYLFRHGGIYFPGAPFALCFGFMLIGCLVACTLKLPPLYIDLEGSELVGHRDNRSSDKVPLLGDEEEERAPEA